ncbi:protein SERAC1 [Microdochium nivale]|nr:protein SERAC1 [Microdochium nivale]
MDAELRPALSRGSSSSAGQDRLSRKWTQFTGRSTSRTASTRRTSTAGTTSSTATSDHHQGGKGPLGLNTLSWPQCETTAHLVFVHGLGGGSRSTWTASNDPALYWPSEWLPYEDGFESVRIHSFGYNSNWDKESVLNVHDFATSLLNALCDSLDGRDQSSQTPIVLVAHSMGGLVIKRAYVLARCRPEFAAIAARIKAMFFLASPHHGADLAQTLSRVLSLGGSRPFVKDLHPQSAVIQALNDEFPRYSQDLKLFSIFETLPTNFGIRKQLVVDRESAILGYVNERVDHLHANHRDVCKYQTQDDANYRTVRNAFKSMLQDLQGPQATTVALDDEPSNAKDQRRTLETFIGPYDSPEEDFIRVDDRRMTGSCEWLTDRPQFKAWLDPLRGGLYHIVAKPGAGKTVLSAKAISHLKSAGLQCCFYFFQHQNRARTDFSPFLISMVWQMALIDKDTLTVCLDILEREQHFNKSNYRTIWRKLMIEGILKSSHSTKFFWVIDALDESCDEVELCSMLIKAAGAGHIHIFTTSRNSFHTYEKPTSLSPEIVEDCVPQASIQSDIELYLQAHLNELPILDNEDRYQMVTRITTKAEECFLWVNLVLQELRKANSSSDIKRILDEVPTDMNALFARIVDSMSRAAYGKTLAKAILTWTICAARPLSTAELEAALKLDCNISVDDVEASIKSSCGHLVTFDGQKQVRMIHLTARDFLLNHQSYFSVNQGDAHRQLATACLRFLNGDDSNERRPNRRRQQNPPVSRSTTRPPFTRYACECLFEHVGRALWIDGVLLTELARFFRSSNILSWIEYIAGNSALSRLADAGKALSTFLIQFKGKTRTEQDYNLADLSLLESWSTDLVRLVMKFGGNLKSHPRGIFNLIAPFCPTGTAPYKQFGSANRSITVRGVKANTWGDCLSMVEDPQEHYSSVASSTQQFAIGCSSGKVMIFSNILYQHIVTLNHKEPVRLLCFNEQGDMLASVGSRNIRVWSMTSKTEIWHFASPQQCMAVTFTGQGRELMGAMKDHRYRIWDLETGDSVASAEWTRGLEAEALKLYRRPVTAAFTPDSQLVAVIYKGQDILLWDIEGDCLFDVYNRESGATGFSGRPYGSAGVRCLAFGTASTEDLLAAAYSDGELVTINISSGEIVHRDSTAFAHLLTASPDGTLLVSADPSGSIQVFLLESLQRLYRINPVEPGIQGLVFSGNGRELLDIRGSRCRIWGPTALINQSGNDSVDHVSPEKNAQPNTDAVLISAISCDDSGDIVFCGKEDGTVHAYDVETGLSLNVVLAHAKGVAVVSLRYDGRSGTITSVDKGSRILVHCLRGTAKAVKAERCLFDNRIDAAIGQVLVQVDLNRILLCSSTVADELWPISTQGSKDNTQAIAIIPFDQTVGSYQWANHPTKPEQLLMITTSSIHIFTWDRLSRVTAPGGILFTSRISQDLSTRYILPLLDGQHLAIMYGMVGQSVTSAELTIFDTSSIEADTEVISPISTYSQLYKKALYLIGTIKAATGASERLIFLQHGGWVSGITLTKADACPLISRYFFFPTDWLYVAHHLDLMIEVTPKGDIVLVKKDEIAVVRKGLVRIEFEES